MTTGDRRAIRNPRPILDLGIGHDASAFSAAPSTPSTAATWPRRWPRATRSISTEVLVLPSRVPPHRAVQPLASPFHRFAMAALAVSGVPRPGGERRRAARSTDRPTPPTRSTGCTPHGLRASQIFFITGADAFADIATWKRYPAGARPRELRRGLAARSPDRRAAVAAAGARRPLRRGRRARGSRRRTSRRFILLQAPTPDVSSTARSRSSAARRARSPASCRRSSRRTSTSITLWLRLTNTAIAADQLHGQN